MLITSQVIIIIITITIIMLRHNRQFIRRYLIYRWLLNTAFKVFSERYWWWVVLSAPCRATCETLVLTNSQPPTSPPLTLRKALLPRQIASTNLPTPKGWIAWLARAHVYVHNLLGVITWLNLAARAGIEPRSTGPRSHSMPMNQPRRTLQAEN